MEKYNKRGNPANLCSIRHSFLMPLRHGFLAPLPLLCFLPWDILFVNFALQAELRNDIAAEYQRIAANEMRVLQAHLLENFSEQFPVIEINHHHPVRLESYMIESFALFFALTLLRFLQAEWTHKSAAEKKRKCEPSLTEGRSRPKRVPGGAKMDAQDR